MTRFETELVQELTERAKTLRTTVDKLGGRPDLSLRLHSAALLDLPDGERSYSIVALCGPTGGGKSTLFNALLESPQASAVGDDVRCCTTEPVAACDQELAVLVKRLLPHAKVASHKVPAKGLILVDCPDINGALAEHRERTSATLECADVAVWVLSGWTTADETAWEWLKEHGLQRRWWIVATVRDGQNPSEIRQSIKANGKRLGLDVPDSMIYVFDTKRQDLDYARFSRTILNDDHEHRIFIAAHDRKLAALEAAFTKEDEAWFTTLADQFLAVADGPSDALAIKYREVFWSGTGQAATGIGPSLSRQLTSELQRRVWVNVAEQAWPPLSWVAMLRARAQTALVAWNLFRGVTGGFNLFRLWSLARAWISAQWVDAAVGRVIQRYESVLDEVDEGLKRASTITIRRHGLRIRAEPSTADQKSSGDLIQDLAADLPVVGPKWSRKLSLISLASQHTSALSDDLSRALDADIDRQAEAEGRKPRRVPNILSLLTVIPVVWAAGLLFQTAYEREWLPPAFYLQFVAIFLICLMPSALLLFAAIGRLRCDMQIETLLRAPKFSWLRSGRLARQISAQVADLREHLTMLKEDATRLRQSLSHQADGSAGYAWATPAQNEVVVRREL